MKRSGAARALIVALALPFAWCAEANAFYLPSAVSVHLRISTTTASRGGTHVVTQTYILDCDPVGGTLPLAASVCGDIREYPQAMLDPPAGAETCAHTSTRPDIDVVATSDGKTTYFGGTPGCHRPGGIADDIYWLASRDKLSAVAFATERLHDEEQ
jgi:hypothetical protein